MNESTKTTLFFAAAVGAIGLALFTRPSTDAYNVDELRGTPLVKEFEPDAPTRLRITSMNDEAGESQAFEVAEVDGVWSIPSKSGYPADAAEQMAAAVEGVVGREILAVIDATSGDHATYGVLDPADASVGSNSGYGTHVKLSGDGDAVLADLLVGNKVKEADGQFYVRIANQDPVYQVAIDLEKFSTNFADWIEKDLLGLNPFDVARISIDDYAIQTRAMISGGRLMQQILEERRAKMDLVYDEASSKWQVGSLQKFDAEKRAYEPFELAEGEQLNEETLDGLKNALDDLVIVDVERKPEGLSGDLQAGKEFTDSNEKKISLAQRGFLPVPGAKDQIELLSSEGQIAVTLKSGVEYVLRFGDLQRDPTSESEPEQGDGNAEGEGLHRYLFVMARFNEAMIEKPELEELPTEATPGEAASAAGSPDTDTSDDTIADPDKDESKEDESDETDTTKEESDTESDTEAERKQIEAERTRIEESNQRLQDEYQEKIEAGRKRVEELNARFGDWYYVIPNDVFKKIHLGREQVIEKKESAEEGEEETEPAAPFGAPGGAIPGLPDLGIGGAEKTEAEESP